MLLERLKDFSKNLDFKKSKKINKNSLNFTLKF